MATATNARRRKRRATGRPGQFSRSIVEEIDETKYLGIRAGARSETPVTTQNDEAVRRAESVAERYGVNHYQSPP